MPGVVREPGLDQEAAYIDPGSDAGMDEEDVAGRLAAGGRAVAGEPRSGGEPVQEPGGCRGCLDAPGDGGQPLAHVPDLVRICLVQDRGAAVHEPQPEGLRVRQARQGVHRGCQHELGIAGKHGEAVAQVSP